MSAKQKKINVWKFCTAKENNNNNSLWMNMLLFIRISKTGAKQFPQEEKVPSQTAAFLEETCSS